MLEVGCSACRLRIGLVMLLSIRHAVLLRMLIGVFADFSQAMTPANIKSIVI
jgi:hypothetical protein